MGSAPCQNCENRHPGCHEFCPKYKEWKKEKDKEREYDKIQRYRTYGS